MYRFFIRIITIVSTLVCMGLWFQNCTGNFRSFSTDLGRSTPKQSDPEKQARCRDQTGTVCNDSSQCRDTCKDIFSSNSHRDDCYELPEELVNRFEDVIEAVEDGEVEDIDEFAAECLLDIEEDEIVRAIRKLSSSKAKQFFIDLVEEDDLAEVFYDEDDEFLILQAILEEIGSNTVDRQLDEELEDGKNVLWFVAETDGKAWRWLDAYVEYKCEEKGATCTGSSKIGAYCGAAPPSTSALRDFLLDTDNTIEEEYESEVARCGGYDPDGFRKYCDIQTIDIDDADNDLQKFAVRFEKRYSCDSSDFSASDTDKDELKEEFEDYCGLSNDACTPTGSDGIPMNTAEHRLYDSINSVSNNDEQNLFKAMIGVGHVYFDFVRDKPDTREEGLGSAFHLGYEVVKDLCSGIDNCINDYFCYIFRDDLGGVTNVRQYIMDEIDFMDNSGFPPRADFPSTIVCP